MKDGAGFFYLNAANQWPGFQLSEALEIAADGALTLKRSQNGFLSKGAFLSGPFEFETKIPRYRVRVWTRDPLPDGAHLQLFTYTGDAKPPAFKPNDNDILPAAFWNSQPRDTFDVMIQGPAVGQQWIGGVMRSDGAAAPAIVQMRVDYGCATYLDFLPAIYAENEKSRDFLQRLLSLDESVLGGLERTITDLPRLFDPDAAPAGDFPSWLSWLAGWLAWDMDEDWSDAQARRFLARAFELYGRRGTIEGLRQYLKTYSGISAHISEPALQTSLWTLGVTSILGVTTMLVPGYAQGAVLDATATLDRSHLTSGNDRGAALFEDVAHRFCVEVYCAELTRADALEDARAVLDREKPAHTEYHLCVIEPRMRVGVQARIGVDAVIASGPPKAQIGMRLGTAVLAETAEECKGGPHGSSRVQ